MTRIIICDDNDIERNKLVAYVKQYIASSSIENSEIIAYSLPQMVLSEQSADVYLLDIIMPMTNGLELCEKIRGINPKAKVIFCTTSREFAIDAFDLRASHYLLKPIEQGKLFAALDEVLLLESHKAISVATKNGLVTIKLQDIAYVEYDNHHLKYKLNNGVNIDSVASRKPFLKEAEGLVKERIFIQPHNAFLVNTLNVKKYNSDCFVMSNGDTIPIAKLKRTVVREQYMTLLSKFGGMK